MNISLRSLVSSFVFLSLLGVLSYSVVTSGVSSDAAVFAFCLLALQGLIECAILSYRSSSASGVRMRLRVERDSAGAPGRVVAIGVGRSRGVSRRSTSVIAA